MARIRFKRGQAVQSLSGTLGEMTFRTINGKTYVHVRCEKEPASDASRKEKALYRRRRIVSNCVGILQEEMEDVVEAIRMRLKLKNRIEYLYDKYVREISAPTKLQRKIMEEYRRRHPPTPLGRRKEVWETSRESLENVS